MSAELQDTLLRLLLDTSFRAVIFAAIVAFVLVAVRIRSSSVRHTAWTTVLLAMLLMPILPHLSPSIAIPFSLPAAIRTDIISPPAILSSSATPARTVALASSAGMGGEQPQAPLFRRDLNWPLTILVLYCVGVTVLLSRTFFGWQAMVRIARECRLVVCPSPVQPKIPVFESETVAAPLTLGIISPRIILPVTWRTWSAQKLTAVLAHESSHVRRRDTLIALLSHLNRSLFWFHPLAWWLERKLASMAELASDDDAVLALGETKLYAQVLVDMAEAVHRQGRRLAWKGVGVNGDGSLGRRIDRVLLNSAFHETSRIRKVIVASGCAAAIFLVASCHQKSPTGTIQEGKKSVAHHTPPSSFWAKKIRILTDPVNAPFEFGEDTGVQGLDVVIGNEIAKNVGIAAKWVKAPSPDLRENRLERVVDTLFGRSPGSGIPSDYEHLFDLVKKGDAEFAISAIAIDQVKSADFEFSKPYYETGDILARRRDRLDITDLASLAGKTVGVTAGRPADAFMAAQRTAAGVAIQRFATIDDSLGALNRGQIDAVVGDEPLITYSSLQSFHNTIALPVLINRYNYAAVVRKGKKELLAKINETIDRLDSAGELKRLDERWLGDARRAALNLRLQDLQSEMAGTDNLSAAAPPR